MFHSQKARKILEGLQVGILDKSAPAKVGGRAKPPRSALELPPQFLHEERAATKATPKRRKKLRTSPASAARSGGGLDTASSLRDLLSADSNGFAVPRPRLKAKRAKTKQQQRLTYLDDSLAGSDFVSGLCSSCASFSASLAFSCDIVRVLVARAHLWFHETLCGPFHR